MNPETSIPPADQDDQEPVLSLIKQIKENQLNPKSLSAEERRRCVDVLGSEGYTVPQIAEILKHGERTIHRDRTELRAAHALRVDSEFAPKMAGELIRQAEGSIARLRKIAREADASAMERSMAENFAFKIHLEMLTKLQSMGYLPRIPSSVVAQVVSGGDQIPTYEQMASRLRELKSLDQERGVQDPLLAQRHAELEAAIQRGLLAAQLEQRYQPHEDPR